MNLSEIPHSRLRIWAIICSLMTGIFIMAVKFYAYRLTRSAAILSDALESIINVVASAAALGCLLFSSRPPDQSHPYGHSRVEYFSAGLEGGLIIVAAVGICNAAWPRILAPVELPQLDSGLLLVLGTSILNLMLGGGLLYVGKMTRSIVLTADGNHIMTDVYTSFGVILGLFLVRVTGYLVLDGIMAVTMAAMILCTGIRLVRHSIAGLMDEADPRLIEEISGILNSHRKDAWIDIHRLRAWYSGSIVRIDFHLVLSRNLSLQEVSQEVKDLHEILDAYFEGLVDILIHSDPCAALHCPACDLRRCLSRMHPARFQLLWHPEKLTSGINTLKHDVL